MQAELINTLVNNNVRAGTILHLGTMLPASADLPDALDDALELDTEEVLTALGIETDDDEDIEDLRELVLSSGKNGWLVMFSTPVPRFYGAEGQVSYDFSWGHYANSWFYGEDYEQLCREAIEWSNEFVAQRRERWERTGK